MFIKPSGKAYEESLVSKDTPSEGLISLLLEMAREDNAFKDRLIRAARRESLLSEAQSTPTS